MTNHLREPLTDQPSACVVMQEGVSIMTGVMYNDKDMNDSAFVGQFSDRPIE